MLHATGSEDDGDFTDMVEGLTMNDAIQPSPGGSFSALTPSMWPQDILARLTQPEVFSHSFDLISMKKTHLIIYQYLLSVRGSKQSTRLSIR